MGAGGMIIQSDHALLLSAAYFPAGNPRHFANATNLSSISFTGLN
jgi:hypothetical protein